MFKKAIFATAALAMAAIASAGVARAADLPVKAKKPVADLPFFLLIDDRVTFSYIFTGTDPGAFSPNKSGTGWNGNTAKQVYSFTHFDIWGYGTNFFTISMYKSDHNDPASPCTGAPTSTAIINSPFTTGCAGATEFSVHGFSDFDRYYQQPLYYGLRRGHRVLRPVPLNLRLERNLRHQGLQHGPAA